MVLCVSTVMNFWAVYAGNVELRLLPVVDCYAETNCGIRSGIKVLHPKRRGVEDVVMADSSGAYVYDCPVALLEVRNLAHDRPCAIGDLWGPDWHVEIVTGEGAFRAKLMLFGGCYWPLSLLVRRHESVCLLIGRLCGWQEYKFRVGYVQGISRNLDRREDKADWPYDLAVVYSNWFSVRRSNHRCGADCVRDVAPKLSLCRLENNVNEKCVGVGVFNDDGLIVDMVALVENDNEFPIKMPIFSADSWTIRAYHSDGRASVLRPFCNSCRFANDSVERLNPREIVAVPVAIRIDAEEYSRLEKIVLRYEAGACQMESELRLDAKSRERVKMDRGSSEFGKEELVDVPL